MSDVSLFFWGTLVSLLWSAAALGPFLFAASKAELDWRARKKEKGNIAPLRPVDSATLSDSESAQSRRRE